MYAIKYTDHLGIDRDGIVIAELPSDDYESPYLIIQDKNPAYNWHEYNGVPYAELRRSIDCEFIGEITIN